MSTLFGRNLRLDHRRHAPRRTPLGLLEVQKDEPKMLRLRNLGLKPLNTLMSESHRRRRLSRATPNIILRIQAHRTQAFHTLTSQSMEQLLIRGIHT